MRNLRTTRELPLLAATRESPRTARPSAAKNKHIIFFKKKVLFQIAPKPAQPVRELPPSPGESLLGPCVSGSNFLEAVPPSLGELRGLETYYLGRAQMCFMFCRFDASVVV